MNERVQNSKKRKLCDSENKIDCGQRTLEQTISRNSAISQERVDKLVTNFVVASLQPFSICDGDNEGGEAFRELIVGLQPCRKVICSKTLKNRLFSTFEDMKNNLIDNMSTVSCVSITVDCWSKARRSYMGVTGHWIEQATLERRCAALSCTRLQGRHTYDVLAAEIENVLDKFRIQHKTSGTTTDNGSNFVKAFKVFGVKLQEEVDDTVSGVDESDPEFVEIFDLLASNDNLSLPPHFRCASHTLNLVAGTDSEEALKDPKYRKLFEEVFSKCKCLWNKQSRSTLAADTIKEHLGVYLKTPNATRWNSTFDAMEQIQTFLSTPEGTEKINICLEKLNGSKFQRNHVMFIKEFVGVMKPLAHGLDLLQRETSMYMGYLLPTIYQIVSNIEKSKDKIQSCRPLINCILRGIRNRFRNIWWSKEFVLASCLHPRFKTDWILEDDSKTEAFGWIIDELQSVQAEKEQVTDSKNDNNSSISSAEDEFFSFPSKPNNNMLLQNSFESEVKSFLARKEKAVSILNDYSNLKNIFIKYNTTVPSSAAVERMFSIASDVFKNKRFSLNDDSFEIQLLLKMNKKYIQ